MKQTIEVTFDVPEGYELTGEYRPPAANEALYNHHSENITSVPYPLPGKEFIARKVRRLPKPGEVWERGGEKYLVACHRYPKWVDMVRLDGLKVIEWFVDEDSQPFTFVGESLSCA